MSTAKDTLQSFLGKVETGKVTSEDIRRAQTILNTSVIISSPPIVLRKANRRYTARRQLQSYRLTAESYSRQEEYYTVQEVADRFKVSDKAVYKWVEQNKIKYERSNENSRDIRIPKAQFKSPPSKATVDQRERELFNEAIEMELVRRKDLYHDEEEQ